MGNQTSTNRNSDELLNRKIAILKANSTLSDREIRDVYSDFQRDCPTGKMNKALFHKYYKKLSDDDDQGGVFSDLVFRVFDTNGDGAIDFSEFVMGYASHNKQDMDSQLDLVYSMLDASGDGRVSYNEMVQFMNVALQLGGEKTRGVTADKAANEIFEAFGLTKQQTLNKKQFTDGCKRSKELSEAFGL